MAHTFTMIEVSLLVPLLFLEKETSKQNKSFRDDISNYISPTLISVNIRHIFPNTSMILQSPSHTTKIQTSNEDQLQPYGTRTDNVIPHMYSYLL